MAISKNIKNQLKNQLKAALKNNASANKKASRKIKKTLADSLEPPPKFTWSYSANDLVIFKSTKTVHIIVKVLSNQKNKRGYDNSGYVLLPSPPGHGDRYYVKGGDIDPI